MGFGGGGGGEYIKKSMLFSAAEIDFQPLPSTTLFIPLELTFTLTIYHAFSVAEIDFTLAPLPRFSRWN
jgi:hypothetical protein